MSLLRTLLFFTSIFWCTASFFAQETPISVSDSISFKEKCGVRVGVDSGHISSRWQLLVVKPITNKTKIAINECFILS